MSKDCYEEFALPYAAEVNRAYSEAGLWSIYHTGEYREDHLLLHANSGASILSVGRFIDMARAKELLGHKICLMGNLDPLKSLLSGTPEEVAAEAARVMNAGKPGGGYIFNTGEVVPAEVPVENMDAMLQAAQENALYV